MHRIYPLAVFSAVLSGLAVASYAAPHPLTVPDYSFINQHVDSVPQMQRQVTLDPVVRRRLARHFHTSGPAIARYIQDNLVLKRITVARTYRVYCIAPDGHEYVINSRLPVGTPVFALRSSGKPILKLACGNPMVVSLPTVKTIPSLEAMTPPALAEMPSGPAAGITPELTPNVPVVVASNFGPGVDVVPAPVIVKVSPSLPTPLLRSSRVPLGFLAGIPILAGILSQGSGNGNTGTPGNTGPGTTGPGTTGPGTTGPGTTGPGTTGPGTTGPGTTGPGTTGPSPVPEPNTATVFLIGGAALAYLVGSRMSRRTRLSRQGKAAA